MTDLLKSIWTEKGLAAVVAAILLGVLLGWLPSPLLTAAQSAATMLTDHVRETSRTVRVLKLICRSVAKDTTTALECDREGGRPDR